MKTNAGLWIDHREAIVVVLDQGKAETTRIESKVEWQPRRSAEAVSGPYESQLAPADDSHERSHQGDLARFYDQIATRLKDAASIFIFGPGEAKGELRKRFETQQPHSHSIETATADRMTEPQIVARVREHFNHEHPAA